MYVEFLNIGQRICVTWEDTIDINLFVCDPVTGTCVNSTFWNKAWFIAGVVFLKMSNLYPLKDQ